MNRREIFYRMTLGGKMYMVDFMASAETEARLKCHFDINTENELLDILGSDFYYLSTRDISQNEGFLKCYKTKLPCTETERICPLGIRWKRGAYDSKFSVDEAITGPLEKASVPAEILAHHYPVPGDFDFTSLLLEADANSDRVRVGGLWSGIMGDCYRMYGFQRFLIDIAEAPDMIHTLVDRMTETYLSLNDMYFQTLKGKMEIWFFGNDFGSQMGLLFNPDMWYDFFYDNIRRLCLLARTYGLKVMMHSCGGIRPIIPYLIKAGVDILDPVQTTASDMAPEELAEIFGGRIIFHGGMDTQQLLPYGSPRQVVEERDGLIRIFTRKGGYIMAPGQVLGRDVPIDNILAMYSL